jgi:hypothetical protein
VTPRAITVLASADARLRRSTHRAGLKQQGHHSLLEALPWPAGLSRARPAPHLLWPLTRCQPSLLTHRGLNAVMESFSSSVKSEVADRFDSCGEAKMESFDYIEVFYNQRRRQQSSRCLVALS